MRIDDFLIIFNGLIIKKKCFNTYIKNEPIRKFNVF